MMVFPNPTSKEMKNKKILVSSLSSPTSTKAIWPAILSWMAGERRRMQTAKVGRKYKGQQAANILIRETWEVLLGKHGETSAGSTVS